MPDAVRSTCSARSTRRIRRSGAAGEPKKHLVVRDREPVIRGQLRVQHARRMRVRAQERHERVHRIRLLAQYLTSHLSPCTFACVLNSSGRKGDVHVHPCRVFGHRHPGRHVVDRPVLVGARVRGPQARARHRQGSRPGLLGHRHRGRRRRRSRAPSTPRASRPSTPTATRTSSRPSSSTPSATPSSASRRRRSRREATSSSSTGDLTIKGVTKPVELARHARRAGERPVGQRAHRARARRHRRPHATSS